MAEPAETDELTDTGDSASSDAFWADDLLGRKDDATFLTKFLLGRISERQAANTLGSYVLNLNAAWGEGKTFFLERFAKSLETSEYVVASVNAWSDDHAEDPLLSVMAAIETVVQNDKKLEAKTKSLVKTLGFVGGQIVAAGGKGLIKQAIKRALGEEQTKEIADLLAEIGGQALPEQAIKALEENWDEEAKQLLAKFKNTQKTINEFKAAFGRFAQELQENGRGPLFVLIDELDRCRPTYAVSLLERIKHLFDVDNVIFVIATDTEQLRHAVCAIYGDGFDSKRYLGRFFNRTYQFEKPSRRKFIAELLRRSPIPEDKISLPPNCTLASFIDNAFDFCGSSLRDVEQAYDILRSVVTVWTARVKLEITVALPLILLHQQGERAAADTRATQALQTIANNNGGNPHAWHVNFLNSESRVPERVHALNLFNDFVGHAQNALPSLNREVTSVYSRWVVYRLSEEFSLLHHNRYAPQNPPFSIIKQYGDLIRSSGRLTPGAEV